MVEGEGDDQLWGSDVVPLLGAIAGCHCSVLWWGEGVFLLEVQYSILKSLISTCVLSYVGSKERIGYLTESASLKRTAGIV